MIFPKADSPLASMPLCERKVLLVATARASPALAGAQAGAGVAAALAASGAAPTPAHSATEPAPVAAERRKRRRSSDIPFRVESSRIIKFSVSRMTSPFRSQTQTLCHRK